MARTTELTFESQNKRVTPDPTPEKLKTQLSSYGETYNPF